MNPDQSRLEKLGLLLLALLSVLALGAIAILAIRAGTIDPNASALIGVIVTGLIAFGKDIVAAIRGYSMSAQLGKVTDQLAASGPATPPASPPPANVIEAAEDVAGAAQDRADQIGAAADNPPPPRANPKD